MIQQRDSVFDGFLYTERHAPLREDISLLGSILWKVVGTQEGEKRVRLVEKVVELSVASRKNEAGAIDSLEKLLHEADETTRMLIARTLATALSLANIAEQHHRIRRRRQRRMSPNASPQPGSLEASFGELISSGVAAETLHKTVLEMKIDLVLTAHPTEVNRRTVLAKQRRIAEILDARDALDSGFGDDEFLMEELHREICALWLTDAVERKRPTPLDEARGGLLVVETSLWEAIPSYARALDHALVAHTGHGLPLGTFPIRFGSWMGGDRDGNPNVTAQTTIEAVALGRKMGLKLFSNEIEKLYDDLSIEPASPELIHEVGAVREPYRALLQRVRADLQSALDSAQYCLKEGVPETRANALKDEDVRKPLLIIYRSLCAVGAEVMARGRLLDVLRLLDSLGLGLVRLDLRQESSRHTAALDALTRHIGLPAYGQLDEQQRVEFLVSELKSRRPLVPVEAFGDEEVREVFATCRAAAALDPSSLGSYIISMAGSASDVLAVHLLLKSCSAMAPRRVVPLFETLDDLHAASHVVAQLLDIPWVRRRVDEDGGRLEVMVGYSDSGKDAGPLAAAWALHETQVALHKECSRRGVRLVLFHGQGGTVGRGGAPAHLAIRSQPAGTLNGELRITEQGEVIQAKLGIPEIAERTLELYTSGVIEATIQPPEPPKPEWIALMDEMAADSLEAYRGLVFKRPEFVEYYYKATPALELSRLNIGSRPARRRQDNSIRSLRAIPWVFAWTQTRLNLPGWLGIGEALGHALEDPEKARLLKKMAKEWPFFTTRLTLAEMVLAKSDQRIHTYYARHLVGDELSTLGEEIGARHVLAIENVREVLDVPVLLESNPVLRRAIEIRNPYIDPLNILQAELLSCLRQETSSCLEDALAITVNGIAAGMKNTG